MYKIRFRFEPGTSTSFQDILVYTASTQLFLRNIHTAQPDHCTLEFESERDRTYALLQLEDPLYTVHAL